MAWYHSSLVYDVNSAKLRIGLRIYFTALFLIIAIVGNQCCRLRATRRLLHQKGVNVSLLTGWLSDISTLVVWFDQRSLPAGFMGVIMLTMALASFGSDLLVSGLVKTTQVPGRCEFGVGVVMPQNPTPWISSPEYDQLSVRMGQQAQNTSVSNGGLSGIFWKYNANPNFRADASDVIGNWTCADSHQDLVLPAGFTRNSTKFDYNIQQIVANLTAKGLLYSSDLQEQNEFCANVWGSLILLSSSQQSIPGPWDIRVTVDADMSNFCGSEGPLTLKSYHCTMNATPVDWVLNVMNSSYEVETWISPIRGMLIDNPSIPANETIASMFEVLTMIGYGGRTPTNSRPWGDPTIGCLRDVAAIPWEVFTLLFLTTLSAGLMFVYWAFLEVLVRKEMSPYSNDSKRSIKDRTPNGLVGWMRYTLRQAGAQDAELTKLSRWKIALGESGEELITKA